MEAFVLDWSYETWVERLAELGQPRFRADQICKWIYRKRVFRFEDMTDLSLELREKLQALWSCGIPEVAAEQVSRKDGTRKLLWRLGDGQSVESVLLDQEGRRTACISTQVGCPLGCAFCATGQSGFVRNLSPGEIVGQFLGMEARYGELQGLVTMGMGEPLLNADSVFLALGALKHPKMRGLGVRHITLSTCGVVPGIRALAASGLGVRLAVSLHAANDALRDRLVPLNAQYPLAELREALVDYQEATRDRISIEYALFEGVNDDPSQARQLGEYLRGLSVFVNLIPGNRSLEDAYRRPPRYRVEQFQGILEQQGFETAVRVERGSDIDAACGQLRQRVEGAEGGRPLGVLPPEPERLPRPAAPAPRDKGASPSRKPRPQGGGNPSRENRPYGKGASEGGGAPRSSRGGRPGEPDRRPYAGPSRSGRPAPQGKGDRPGESEGRPRTPAGGERGRDFRPPREDGRPDRESRPHRPGEPDRRPYAGPSRSERPAQAREGTRPGRTGASREGFPAEDRPRGPRGDDRRPGRSPSPTGRPDREGPRDRREGAGRPFGPRSQGGEGRAPGQDAPRRRDDAGRGSSGSQGGKPRPSGPGKGRPSGSGDKGRHPAGGGRPAHPQGRRKTGKKD